MPRPQRNLIPRPPRITHAYGQDLRWSPLPRRTRLTGDVAVRLRTEGYTMVLARTGWFRKRQVSLIRFLQNTSPPR